MPQKYIEIRSARENNLKNVSLRTPKRKITIFTGGSGSGKSSIVYDTIANPSGYRPACWRCGKTPFTLNF